MQVRLLLFAQFRDLAGTDQVELQVHDGATAGDVVAQLRADARWRALPATPAVAVNRSYAPLTTQLADGDELALIPPVAGG
jgi:molybdopterin synthase catalytic subunit